MATNNIAESSFAGVISHIQKFSRINIPSAAAVSDMRRNKFFKHTDEHNVGWFRKFPEGISGVCRVHSGHRLFRQRKRERRVWCGRLWAIHSHHGCVQDMPASAGQLVAGVQGDRFGHFDWQEVNITVLSWWLLYFSLKCKALYCFWENKAPLSFLDFGNFWHFISNKN